MKKYKRILKRKVKFVVDPIKNYLTKGNHRRVNIYAKYYENCDIVKNTILYESRDGKSITDSPYAMFKVMLNNPDYKDYVHFWSVEDSDILSPIIKQYDKYNNVKFVKRNSREYLKCLASCEYVINNSTFQPFYIAKKGQVYINTWHGTPLKKMGFDIPGNPANPQNVVRNFLSTDYLLSPNEHTTRMYIDSYKLKDVYPGKIIEEGYPRIDLTLNVNRADVIERLNELGLKVDSSKQNILYAPTWKGTNVSKANNDVLQMAAEMKYLQQTLQNKYNVLVKVHPFLYKRALQNSEIKEMLIPDFMDTNELLGATDILVTDYSSIFFDYLVTDKPIIFYTWDLEEYTSERGQYIENEDLPGPLVYNIKELSTAIQDIKKVSQTYAANYKELKKQFTKYEDGNVSQRVVDGIFKSQLQDINVIECYDAKKEKMLIYPGGMRDNGITSSFVNLMNNIDFNKYDVVCYMGASNAKEVLKNLNKVDKRVLFMFKPGLPVYGLFETYRDKFIHNRGERGFLGKMLYPKDAYRREHIRLFGKTKYDYIIDFSGYSLYWTKNLLEAEAKKKLCFMHSDVLADSERTINGKRPHRINLRGLFSVYHRFDKLVSVSKGTMEVNRQNLLEYADYDKFTYVMNTIDPDKILGDELPTSGEEKSQSDINFKAIKARAAFNSVKEISIWNTLPGNINAHQYKFNIESTEEELFVSKKALIDNELYYKCALNQQVIGWVSSEDITILPDNILSETRVDKIARIHNTRGVYITTAPYNVEGLRKVSASYGYKGILVHISQEAQTIHGTYSRFSINNQVIGWIDNRALVYRHDCTITDSMTGLQRNRVKRRQKEALEKNYERYKEFINKLEDRTLEEVNFVSGTTYAKISKPETYTVWTKAYPNYLTEEVASAETYKDMVVELKAMHRTREGSYYRFAIEGEMIGWLDVNAFEILNLEELKIEKDVNKKAKISIEYKKNIWSKPHGLIGAEKVLDIPEILYGKIVNIDKEVTTFKGTYAHIISEGTPIGWMNVEGLIIQPEPGFILNGKFISDPTPDNINFVTMGRLSPEKGQDNLIKAFGEFNKKFKNSRLYILGKGALKDDLQQLIDDLELNDVAFLVGQRENPFTFLKKCDCFVLSSHYEGQPMVLLEAMTLGMKIIATDIIANQTVLEDGKYGLLVENSINGLKEGMEYIAVNTAYKPEKFDYLEYNNKAMESFIEACKG